MTLSKISSNSHNTMENSYKDELETPVSSATYQLLLNKLFLPFATHILTCSMATTNY